MKHKTLAFVLLLVLACLASPSCVTSSGDGDNNDGGNKPDFVQDTCSGCAKEEYLPSSSNATSIIFYSYVKNNGGAGKISMTIGAEGNTATAQFDVTAGTSYVFQATVPVEKSSTSSFTYSAKFPGSPGYTDTHSISGYHHTGAPSDLQLKVK
jgi:hypothetical protein